MTKRKSEIEGISDYSITTIFSQVPVMHLNSWDCAYQACYIFLHFNQTWTINFQSCLGLLIGDEVCNYRHKLKINHFLLFVIVWLLAHGSGGKWPRCMEVGYGPKCWHAPLLSKDRYETHHHTITSLEYTILDNLSS